MVLARSARLKNVLRASVVGATLLAAACAPHVQTAMQPPAAFTGPQMSEPLTLNGMGVFTVQDGAQLPYRRWSPQGRPKAVIIAVHGFNDSSASWRLAGPWWAEQGVEVWAYDQRGFGGAPNRGQWSDPELSREDLRTVTALIRQQRPDARIAIMGESMGGALGITAFASERPPQADALILLAPAVWGWSSQNLLNRTALWTAAHALGARAIEPPEFAVQRIRPSDNTIELLRNSRDPNFIIKTRFDSLHGLVNLMEEGSRDLGRVRVPTLLAYGARDTVVPRKAMKLALQRAGSAANLETAYYPEGWHILNRDLAAEVIFTDVLAWLEGRERPSKAPEVLPSLLGN